MHNNGNGHNGKPRIALLHYSGPPVISGVELVIRDQARLFRFFNYKVSLILGSGTQFRKDIPVHKIKAMSSTSASVLKIRRELKQNIVSKTFYSVEQNLFKRLKDFIESNNITVVIVHNVMTRHYNLPLTSALAKLAKTMPHVRFVAWVHDTSFSDTQYFKIDANLATHFPWSLLVTPLDNWTYVCISDFRKKELLMTFGKKRPRKLVVIPNGIDVEKYLRLSPQMRAFYKHIGGLNADLIACTPVRLVRRKNLELGIGIIDEILKKGIDVRYIITGYPDQHQENQTYYQKLKKYIAAHKLENNVFFLAEYLNTLATDGKAQQVQVEEVYDVSDFLLMTSTIEGFGLPLLEAGLSRTPIFASDIKPFHEIGTTNINYFSLTSQPARIASFIVNKIGAFPQSYFYRKVIKKYSLEKIFREEIIPLVMSEKRATI